MENKKMEFINANEMRRIADNKKKEEQLKREEKARQEAKYIIDTIILPKAQEGYYSTTLSIPEDVDYAIVKNTLISNGYKADTNIKNRTLFVMW